MKVVIKKWRVEQKKENGKKMESLKNKIVKIDTTTEVLDLDAEMKEERMES